jgi:hypothetical protein
MNFSGSYTEETRCMKSTACNMFHVNSFLLVNTQEELSWFSLQHVIKHGECFVSVVMVTSTKKKKKTILGT